MMDLDALSLLASAIADKAVETVPALDDITNATSDGRTIYVRPEVEDWHGVVAQSSLIAAGAFDPWVMRQLIGRARLARRYTIFEFHRGVHLCKDRVPQAFFDVFPAIPAPTVSCMESLQAAQSGAVLPVAPSFLSSIKSVLVLRKIASDKGLAQMMASLNPTLGAAAGGAPSPSGEEEESKLAQILVGGSWFSDLLSSMMGRGEKASDPATQNSAGMSVPTSPNSQEAERGAKRIAAANASGLIAAPVETGRRSVRYPEWDTHQGAYRPDYVSVKTKRPERPDGPQAFDGAFDAPHPLLVQSLAHLGLKYERRKRQRDGDDLDTDALIECAIDLSAGHPPAAPTVYRAMRRSRRDLGVVIALDASGSSEDLNPQGLSVFDLQMRLAFQLCQVFSTLGDTTAMFGFQTGSQACVDALLLKDPKETWSGLIVDRMRRLEPLGYTRTGAVIRHGAALARKDTPHANRLLIIITDGIAYDTGYEGNYAHGDVKKALEEVREEGCACVCVSIGAGLDMDTFSDVYGAANLVIADDIEDTIRLLGPALHLALKTALKGR